MSEITLINQGQGRTVGVKVVYPPVQPSSLFSASRRLEQSTYWYSPRRCLEIDRPQTRVVTLGAQIVLNRALPPYPSPQFQPSMDSKVTVRVLWAQS